MLFSLKTTSKTDNSDKEWWPSQQKTRETKETEETKDFLITMKIDEKSATT